MRYVGGKSKIASQIAQLLKSSGGGTFISLFCGSCAVECKVQGFDKIICNDKHPYLIALYRGLQNGFEPPDIVSEEQYRYVREHKDENPPLTGFVGFACSFGGKWWGGYARARKSVRGYAHEGKASLLRQLPCLKEMEFVCGDYKDVPIPQGSVIYADPPYFNTTKYKYGIDHDEFWEYMRELARRGNKVFVSEQTAPPDFKCVWEKPLKRTLDRNKSNQFYATEKLFTLED